MMIIKNNFNEKDANPLPDYKGIGKGINSLDKYFEEQNGVLNKNVDNKVIQDILNKDKEYEDDTDDGDKWKFFR